jgi:hypothetical protein
MSMNDILDYLYMMIYFLFVLINIQYNATVDPS